MTKLLLQVHHSCCLKWECSDRPLEGLSCIFLIIEGINSSRKEFFADAFMRVIGLADNNTCTFFHSLICMKSFKIVYELLHHLFLIFSYWFIWCFLFFSSQILLVLYVGQLFMCHLNCTHGWHCKVSQPFENAYTYY